MRTLKRHVALATLLVLTACAAPPAEVPDTRAADAATIHALVKDWSAAAQAKDAETFVSVYAQSAVLLLEGAPDLAGVEAIREAVNGMMQDPNFDLSFEADAVKVARAGDMAYETGTYSMTMSDPEGTPSTQSGHYVVLWEKQADGSWKVVVDAPVSDPPGEAATEEAAAE